jgi:hypothetical protein
MTLRIPYVLRRDYRRPIISLVAFGIIFAYSSLALAATLCIPDLTPPIYGHHHHTQDGMAHTLLCAWACQANATPALVTSASMATVLSLSSEVPMVPPSLHQLFSPYSGGARGPPQAVSFSIAIACS